jgi:ATP-dependent RNA helicase SUPV3L1/SUV3
MTTSVAEAGEVIVEGEHLGRIEGFRFLPDATEGPDGKVADQKAVLGAALRALRENLPTRLQAFTSAPDGELVFDSQLRICWGGGPIARLMASGDVLAPKVEALASDLLDGPAREEVRKRAAAWVETRIRLGLSELMDARASSEALPPGARGIVFQLCENLGILPRRPIEQQMAELSEDDRKALAKLGVRVGVFSLYFPSMLKPVPIRLRAGLWMVAHNRDSIPPLPAEGRTSMDLPPGAEREFYGAIGYVPLGNHAIRADMVERLAAMARAAVRESRENARRAQQEKQEQRAEAKPPVEAKAEPTASTSPTPSAFPTPPTNDEISEWAIVAAAFGESEPEPAPVATPEVEAKAEEAVPETAPAEPIAYATEEAAPEHAPAEETQDEPKGEQPEVTAEAAPPEAAPAEAAEEPKVEATEPTNEAPAEETAPEPAKPEGPRPLPPGWFRAAPQMMSLVGCSEPEMADVLRGLGYRVHPPSDEHGPLFAFSVKPRFVREREEQRERQRQQERERRDQRRRERPEGRESRPNERQFFADAPRRDRPPGSGPKPDRRDGPPQGGPPQGDKRGDRPPRDDRRGPRPPRRDADGPALRLYATTEKKGDVSDSPFAKLLELKLGGKK